MTGKKFQLNIDEKSRKEHTRKFFLVSGVLIPSRIEFEGGAFSSSGSGAAALGFALVVALNTKSLKYGLVNTGSMPT
jgi:hypothetical protein